MTPEESVTQNADASKSDSAGSVFTDYLQGMAITDPDAYRSLSSKELSNRINDYVDTNLPALDTDNNGFISKPELSADLGPSRMGGENPMAANYILSNFALIAGKHQDALEHLSELSPGHLAALKDAEPENLAPEVKAPVWTAVQFEKLQKAQGVVFDLLDKTAPEDCRTDAKALAKAIINGDIASMERLFRESALTDEQMTATATALNNALRGSLARVEFQAPGKRADEQEAEGQERANPSAARLSVYSTANTVVFSKDDTPSFNIPFGQNTELGMYRIAEKNFLDEGKAIREYHERQAYLEKISKEDLEAVAELTTELGDNDRQWVKVMVDAIRGHDVTAPFATRYTQLARYPKSVESVGAALNELLEPVGVTATVVHLPHDTILQFNAKEGQHSLTFFANGHRESGQRGMPTQLTNATAGGWLRGMMHRAVRKQLEE